MKVFLLIALAYLLLYLPGESISYQKKEELDPQPNSIIIGLSSGCTCREHSWISVGTLLEVLSHRRNLAWTAGSLTADAIFILPVDPGFCELRRRFLRKVTRLFTSNFISVLLYHMHCTWHSVLCRLFHVLWCRVLLALVAELLGACRILFLPTRRRTR